MRKRFPMNLQFFAEPGGTPGGTGGGTGGTAGGGTEPNNPTPPQFDYDKLASLIAGKTSVTEDTVLKSYFKQQGLSQDEMNQAIQAFKQQKAANQPDVGALQQQASQAQAEARQAQLQAAATMAAVGLGLDAKVIPYIIKMSDFSQAVGQDGKINEETVKNALNKVLEDVPALKPQTTGSSGFIQVGAAGGNQQSSGATDDVLKAAFGLT